MKNILYLMEMGMNDENITTDIKNHRVRVLKNIDILYKNEKYNMFFEFLYGTHHNYRTINKRTGKPLKKAVDEIIIKDGIFVDTEFTRVKKDSTGFNWTASYRKLDLEKEIFNEHLPYTQKSVLEIVNRYKIGEPFTDVCLIETTAADIIRKKGGYREKEILGDGKNFQTQGDSYFVPGLWNEDHMIIRCQKREWQPCGNGRKLVETDFCDVDIATGKFTD